MKLTIHFFRDNSLERLDFSKVLEFFENFPDFKIFYTDEKVEIVYDDQAFGYKYRYLITKKSRVHNIYKINPQYANINFLLEMPTIIPTFLAKEILTIAQRVSKLFDLTIYHDSFEDARQFNLVDVLVLFDELRSGLIEEHGMHGKQTLNNDILNEICKYQRSLEGLREYYNFDISVNLILPVVNRNTNKFSISYPFKVGEETLFPPHLDFIKIIEPDETAYFVRFSYFYELFSKHLEAIDHFLPNMYLLKGRRARRARRELKKLRRNSIDITNFSKVNLSDVLDI